MKKSTISRFLTLSATLAAASMLANAGTISGTVSGGKGISVVYVEAVPGKTFPGSTKRFEIDQKSLLFQPHVIVAPVGAVVEFLNNDKVAHNIFWPAISGNKKLGHNLGTWPTGQKRDFKFDTPGIVPLLCNVHPEMSGFVIVTPTPFFAESDASGAYKIADVPDGSYTVTAWREGMKLSSQPVKVAGAATQNFTLTK